MVEGGKRDDFKLGEGVLVAHLLLLWGCELTKLESGENCFLLCSRTGE